MSPLPGSDCLEPVDPVVRLISQVQLLECLGGVHEQLLDLCTWALISGFSGPGRPGPPYREHQIVGSSMSLGAPIGVTPLSVRRTTACRREPTRAMRQLAGCRRRHGASPRHRPVPPPRPASQFTIRSRPAMSLSAAQRAGPRSSPVRARASVRTPLGTASRDVRLSPARSSLQPAPAAPRSPLGGCEFAMRNWNVWVARQALAVGLDRSSSSSSHAGAGAMASSASRHSSMPPFGAGSAAVERSRPCPGRGCRPAGRCRCWWPCLAGRGVVRARSSTSTVGGSCPCSASRSLSACSSSTSSTNQSGPVGVPIPALGQCSNHARIFASSVVASLNPCSVYGLLSCLVGKIGRPPLAYASAA